MMDDAVGARELADDCAVAHRREGVDLLSVECVAKAVAGVPAIGNALKALQAAGWRATIAGNRITVNEQVFVQFIASTVGKFGRVGATCLIYSVAEPSQVWVVGTGFGDGVTQGLETA
ncbi:MAG TPA: hypothetical protein VET27_18995 [Mycobacterium sp.]|nr:hypothetical protein [Mycobacterium sp.]